MTLTIESLIRKANPVALYEAPSIDEDSARRLLDHILATPSPRATVRRPRTVVAIAVGALTAVLLIALVLSGLVGQSSPATAVLLRLSDVAATLPMIEAPVPGQFQYTNSLSFDSIKCAQLIQHPYLVDYVSQRQIWVGPNGSERLLQTWSDPTFPTAHEHANWVLSGSPSLARLTTDQTFGAKKLSDGPTSLWALPTNPTKLAAMIASRTIEGGLEGPSDEFEQVGDLLRESDAPSALRAALFRVATKIPGVELLGPTKDHLGRTGIGLAYSAPSSDTSRGSEERHVLIFNPATSALLGEQTVAIDPSTGASTITTWTSYVATAVVNSTIAVAPTAALGP
jgi:hypothetical protein